jgi:hypothetical protein
MPGDIAFDRTAAPGRINRRYSVQSEAKKHDDTGCPKQTPIRSPIRLTEAS